MSAVRSTEAHPPFAQLLPAEITAGSTWFGRARSYPVFSPTWYRYRSLALAGGSIIAFALMAAIMAAPIAFQNAVASGWADALHVVAVFLLPLLALCMAGPGLAVLVRQHTLARCETAALFAALLLGIALAAGLFAALAAHYEQPRRDDAGNLVARFLPQISIRVQAGDGDKRIYAARPDTAAIEEMRVAVEILARANTAAGAPAHVVDQATIHGPADEQAFKDMQMLDQGANVTPERRAAIKAAYRLAQAKLRQHGERVAALHNSGVRYPAPTPEQAAAITRVAAATARLSAPVTPAPRQAMLSGQIQKLALLAIAAGLVLLLAWLSGLVDLITYIRQRGQLVDVLGQKELERARTARAAAEMRLSVLAAQVEPHFLFNTLAGVRSAIESDPQRAMHIVDHMVAYLRSSIPQMRDDATSGCVTLGSQMHAARCYLALMRERMPRLQFSVEGDQTLEPAQVPPLMLISLVENAIKHGVEPKIGPASIAVHARSVDHDGEAQLEICVTDDGVGFGEAATGGGIGLTNIQQRLHSFYGACASLTLKTLPGGGVAAILRMPLSFEH